MTIGRPQLAKQRQYTQNPAPDWKITTVTESGFARRRGVVVSPTVDEHAMNYP
jgi:hypothetical protein